MLEQAKDYLSCYFSSQFSDTFQLHYGDQVIIIKLFDRKNLPDPCFNVLCAGTSHCLCPTFSQTTALTPPLNSCDSCSYICLYSPRPRGSLHLTSGQPPQGTELSVYVACCHSHSSFSKWEKISSLLPRHICLLPHLFLRLEMFA